MEKVELLKYIKKTEDTVNSKEKLTFVVSSRLNRLLIYLDEIADKYPNILISDEVEFLSSYVSSDDYRNKVIGDKEKCVEVLKELYFKINEKM